MISIDHVSFGYGEAQETLSQVSAVIAPGECVLLCGASGCGKTTVTKLINGLIPSFTPGCRLEGRVEVDGLDPGTTPMYELARKVGSVFQNPKSQFFNLDTDSELAFGLENEGRPPEEIRRRVADTVEALHLQELQRRSIFSLSGGQKQLLTIARAMLLEARMLILDEATSNVDTRTEIQIQEAMRKLMEGKTCFVIAHRLSTIRNADLILVIKQGEVVEKGTHEELMRAEGEYFQMYTAQGE